MTGTVYQRSSDGLWVASLQLNGKKLVRYPQTERQARTKLTRLHQELGLGRLSPPTRIIFEEWVTDWLQEKSLRPSTRITYTRILGQWSAEIGQTKLTKLTPPVLRSILRTWQKQGMGSRSLEQHWTYLHGCLQGAVDLGILSRNPLDQVTKPRHQTPQMALWTPEQALAFLNGCLRSQRSHADLPAFLLLTGLRLGEALALSPEQVKGSRAVIQSALVWQSSSLSWQRPKTESGERVLSLHPLAQLILLLNDRGQGTYLQTQSGTPPRPSNLSRLMTHLCQESQVPRIELRALRRVHSALLVDGGLDIKSLQAHLGHSKAAISLDIYAYQADRQDGHAQALARSLGLI